VSRRLDEPQGRGAFFKSLGTLMAGFIAERIEDAVVSAGPVLLRPPGALDELAFLTACTRCDRCLPACPQEAILKAPAGAGLSAGTPYLQPRGIPCFLCSELPCIPACPEGALVWPRRGALAGPRAVRMGTARIKTALCLTYPAPDREPEACRLCVDRCPFPGEAIRLSGPQPDGRTPDGRTPDGRTPDGPSHPEVLPDHCTGCGLCVFACPASEPAIVVDPRR
jgi:ferredoxin-type protein NapG